MLQLVAALVLAAATPAPAPAAQKAAEPAAETNPPPAKADEKPLDEAGRKVARLAEMFTAQTKDNVATYLELLASLKDPKDCAAVAKAATATSKKHDAEQAKKQAAAEALRKPMPQDDQRAAAGKALVAISADVKKFRESLTDHENAIGVFKGKCPKQGDEVEKIFTGLRKHIAP